MSVELPPLELTLDEEQRLLRRTARELLQERAPAGRLRGLRGDATGYSPELWRDMAELGWVGLAIPEIYGGAGLGFFELAIVLEEVGRQLAPEPFLSTVLLGAQALLLGGTEEQRRAWLPRVASGEAILSLAYEEHGTREAIERTAASARRSGKGFVLAGTKRHAVDAHVADAVFVLARTAGTPGEQDGLTLFLVSAEAKGLGRATETRIDGRRGATVTLSGVEVGEDAVVGEIGRAASLLEGVLARAAVGLSAEMLGGASRAFEMTLEYLKDRVQFGRPIGSFQALQHRAARLYVEIELLRSAVAGAARAIDDVPDATPLVAALAKATASETFELVAKEAIQMHGGIGMTDEHDIGLYLKRARACAEMLGTAAFHRRRWAELKGY